ncbi:MAG: hypothetical protein Q8Q81_01015 [Oxalobacteraceae bacterium]|nr:hypothetical protein [Oxalobacteraceae bacterium]
MIAIALATSLSLLAGCEKAEMPLPKADTTEPPAPQTEAAQGGANGAATVPQSERESTLKMARQEIDQLKTKIDELGVKAKDASAALKEKLTAETRVLEQGLKELETKFNALKDASAGAWADMKASFNASLDKLKQSVGKSGQQSKPTGSSY